MRRFLPSDGACSNNFENLPLGPQSSRALPQFLGTFPGSGGDCSEVSGGCTPFVSRRKRIQGIHFHHALPSKN